MYLIKDSETNEVMQFETREAVAQWFNFFEDIYDDNVWDKFIESQFSRKWKIKWVEDDKNDPTDEEFDEICALFDNEEFLKILNKLILNDFDVWEGDFGGFHLRCTPVYNED